MWSLLVGVVITQPTSETSDKHHEDELEHEEPELELVLREPGMRTRVIYQGITLPQTDMNLTMAVVFNGPLLDPCWLVEGMALGKSTLSRLSIYIIVLKCPISMLFDDSFVCSIYVNTCGHHMGGCQDGQYAYIKKALACSKTSKTKNHFLRASLKPLLHKKCNVSLPRLNCVPRSSANALQEY